MDSILSTSIPSLIELGELQSSTLWALIVGVLLAFILGGGMGGNDVSNAFGTSVGSKAVTIRQAYILATIFETLGAVLVGYSVTDTMRKSVVDVSIYNNSPHVLLYGQVAALGGTSAWLIIATIFSLPVSTTHALVGATLGWTLVMKGTNGVVWKKIGHIAISWVASPVLSGSISSIIYLVVDHLVLRKENPLEAGFTLLPVFYFVCIGLNVFMVLYDGSPMLHFDDLPLWACILIAGAFGLVASILVQFILKPTMRAKMSPTTTTTTLDIESAQVHPIGHTNDITAWDKVKADSNVDIEEEKEEEYTGSMKVLMDFLPCSKRVDDEKTLKLFGTLQLFTACYAGFAHGANDVSNALAPLTAIVAIYRGDFAQSEGIPFYVLLYGVTAICLGLWLFGHNVIKTVGTHMSQVTPASGFCIEFGAALTALIASKIGLPISTTHCLIGSVVAVGMLKSVKRVNWTIFRNVAMSWVVTLPAAGAISAVIMFILKIVLGLQ